MHDILLLDFDWFYFNLDSYFSLYVWGFIIIYWSWGEVQTQSLIHTRQVFYCWLVSSVPCFFFFFKICYLYFIICRHVCLHVGVCVCMRVKLSWEVRGIRYPGAGVIYGCDLPDMGSRSQTWVL